MPDLQTLIAVVVEAETQAAQENLTAVQSRIAEMGRVVDEGGQGFQRYGSAMQEMAQLVVQGMNAQGEEADKLGQQFMKAFQSARDEQGRFFSLTTETKSGLQQLWAQAVSGANSYTQAVNRSSESHAELSASMDAAIARLTSSTSRASSTAYRMWKDTSQEVVNGANNGSAAYERFGGRAQQSLMGVSAALSAQKGVLGELATAAGQLSFQFLLASQYGSSTARVIANIGAGLSTVGMVANAAAEPYTTALGRLDASLQNVNSSLQEHQKEVDKTVKVGEHLGHAGKDTADAMNRLVVGFKDANAGSEYFGIVADLAAHRQESLSEAAAQFVRIVEGHYARGLKDILPTFKFTEDATKDLEAAQKRLTQATQHVADAQQHLQDVEQKAAQQHEDTSQYVDREKNALERLNDTQQNLQDVQDRMAARALDNMLKEQQERAKARLALDDYNQALQHFTSLTNVNQGDVERMQEAMKKQAAGVTGQSSSDESNLQGVNDRIQLRDAQQAVTKAQEDYNQAQAAAVKHAQDLTAVDIELRNAHRRVADALADQGQANRDIAKDQQLLQDRAGDTARVMAALQGAIGGEAEKQAQTHGGTMRRIRAEIEDEIAKIGAKWGGVASILGGALQAFGGVANLFGARMAGAGAASMAGAETAEVAGGIFASASFLSLGVIGLLGLAIYEIIKHWKGFSEFFENLGGAIFDFGAKVWHWLQDNWSKIPGMLFEGFYHMQRDIDAWVLGMVGKFLEFGKNIVIGLWNGIVDRTEWIIGKFAGFAKSFLHGFASFFGFGSPSRLMAQHGAWLVEGLAQGMDAQSGEAVKAATRLQTAVAGVLTPGGRSGAPATGTLGIAPTQAAGGVTIVQNNVIQGSVWTEDELMSTLKEKASRDAARNNNWIPAR